MVTGAGGGQVGAGAGGGQEGAGAGGGQEGCLSKWWSGGLLEQVAVRRVLKQKVVNMGAGARGGLVVLSRRWTCR